MNYVASALAGACLGVLFTIIPRLVNMDIRMRRMEIKMDALLKHSGVEFDPMEAYKGRISDAVEAGNKVEAVKLYRESTGISLPDAKAFIERCIKNGKFDG